MPRPPPRSTLFPYTTLFRSKRHTTLQGAFGGIYRQLYVSRSLSPPTVEMLDRKSTRLNSSHGYISYAVFCLKKKNTSTTTTAYTGRMATLPSDICELPLPKN